MVAGGNRPPPDAEDMPPEAQQVEQLARSETCLTGIVAGSIPAGGTGPPAHPRDVSQGGHLPARL